MVKRLEALVGTVPVLRRLTSLPGSALREAWREGYGYRQLRADALAGCVVGVIALPLSMALAIASGVPPQHGLYTAIVAGGLIALLGGSRVQVSGPTAAFVVILAPISAKYGLAGLCTATLMAGVFLLGMGALRLGRLIEFIPYPVTAGFTAGIAIVIATLQLNDFLGLRHVPAAPTEAGFVEKVWAMGQGLSSVSWPDLAIGVGTLAVLVAWNRWTRKVPAALVALAAAAVAAVLLERHGMPVATIHRRFAGAGNPHGIPQLPPVFVLPWDLPGPQGAPGHPVDLALVRTLMPSALAIALLGAIESLLSAVVADGMTGRQHDPDAELLALGAGNVVAPFFGGIAATGAIARTAANIRSGGRSPLAAVVHALFVLGSVLALAPLLGYLPMASMAALLLVVAWNMSEARHVVHTLRVAPRSDALVLVTCLSLTVLLDMTVAVTAGVLLAALLFMRRMAEIAGAKLIGDHHPELGQPLPRGLVVYEIAGPLFFGAAQKAMSELRQLRGDVRVVVIDMTDVPVMDATGLVNLESAVDRLYRAGIFVILAGVQAQPAGVLERAQWSVREGRIAVFRSFDEGLATARTLLHLVALDPAHATLAPQPA